MHLRQTLKLFLHNSCFGILHKRIPAFERMTDWKSFQNSDFQQQRCRSASGANFQFFWLLSETSYCRWKSQIKKQLGKEPKTNGK